MSPPHPGHRSFAAAYDLLTGPAERTILAGRRRRLLADCGGDVLDVGCGTGANFPLLAELGRAGRDLRLQATEPDPHMLRRAIRRAARLGLTATFHDAPAEALPFPPASFDFVLSTFVLCTVANPAAAVAEMHRVLRPGGELRFIEHVQARSERGSRWQSRLRGIWATFAGGCQLDRRTGAELQAAPFAEVDWEEWANPFPIYLALVGRARKARGDGHAAVKGDDDDETRGRRLPTAAPDRAEP